jgi:hypothetical protein
MTTCVTCQADVARFNWHGRIMNDLLKSYSSVEVINPQIPTAGGFRRSLRKVFSFPAFVGAMVSLAAVAATTVTDGELVPGGKVFVEGDSWWQITIGRLILSTHTWPTADSYSFTMRGTAFVAHDWLGDVVMAIAVRLAGLQGLAALFVFLAISLAVLIYYYAWLRSRSVLGAGIATVLVLQVAEPIFGMRPQMLGYAFLIVTLICLEHFKQGRPKALWPLPLIFLLWVNAHGSFVLGFFVLGVYWASGLVQFSSNFLEAKRWTPEQRLHLLWISLLSLVAAMVTPYGARLAVYPVEMVTNQRFIMFAITEWQSLQFSTHYAHVFLALLLLILLLQVAKPVTYRLETLGLLLFAIAESCLHARFLMFFAIIFAPVLATFLSNWLPANRPTEDHPFVNAVLISAVALGIVALFPSFSKLKAMLATTYPVGAVRYLQEHPGLGNMFNTDLWGGYLIWAIPERKVFIDGRMDIYEYGGVLRDYYNFINLQENPDQFFEKYGLKAALVKPGDPITRYLQTLPDWTIVFRDSTSIIFARASGTIPAKAVETKGPEFR